jgi:hypothetical protein
MRFLRFPAILLFLFACVLPLARAHQVDSVEFILEQTPQEWRLAGEMDIAFMLPETRGVPGEPPLSRVRTMQASPQELARMRAETEKTLRKLLTLTFGEKEVPWSISFPDFDNTPIVLPVDAGDIALLSVVITTPALNETGELRAHWKDELGSEFMAASDFGGKARVLTAASGRSTVLLRVEKTADATVPAKTEVPETHIGEWLFSGFHHVLPLGLDHLLFILGLFLLLPKWKPLMFQSLLFTLAHSTTLALAVLGVVNVPGRPVEILIAASIAWIGIENLITKKLGKGRMVLVFCFGLIHGLGFASVLAEKLQGVPKSGMILPLLGFNVGVELAQITVLAIAFLILWPLKKWTRQVQIVGSVLVALGGLNWMFQRIFGA